MGTSTCTSSNPFVPMCMLGMMVLLPIACLLPTAAAVTSSPRLGQQLFKHGTLVISSIHLLDSPANTSTQQLIHEAAAVANISQRCCLSVKLYSTAVQQHSSTARHAVGHPAGLAPAAAFSTCSHSQATGCRESLLQDISSHNATKPYKVALLLPAHTFTPDPHQSHSPAAASSPSIDKQAGMQDSSSGVSDSATEDATTSADESSTADAMQPTLPSAAQHSSVQGLLLTVHVEQEVAGQINLAKATQYIPAGMGIVRLDVNMSHHSHTWTGPAVTEALLASLAQHRTKTAHAGPANTLEASANTAVAAPAASKEHAVAATDVTSSCPPIPEPNCTAAVLEAYAMHTGSSNSTAGEAGSPAAVPAGLAALLPAQVTSDPAVLAYVLQTVLGHEQSPSAWGAEQQQPGVLQQQGQGPLATAALHADPCAGCTSQHSSSRCRRCRCPVLPDMTDPDAVNTWAAAVESELLSCQHHTSLSSYMDSAAAAAALRQYSRTASQHTYSLLASIAALPAVTTVLDRLYATGLPVVASAAPEHLLLGLLAAGLLTSLLLVNTLLRMCCAVFRKKPAQLSAAAQQQQAVQQQEALQQQQQRRDSTAHRGSSTAKDAMPQQQDQYTTLEDHMQDIDDDIFGYGAAPAPLPVTAAGSNPPGSMLAASCGFRRASTMAVTEAAGALKDAFMRRHTNQVNPSAAAAIGAGSHAHPAAAAAAGGGGMLASGSMLAAGGGMLAAGTERDWLNEEDEDRVNQAPESIQRQLAAGGRWRRDAEGRLVRGSWKGMRNSLSAAAMAVMAAVGTGGRAAAAAAVAAVANGRASLRGGAAAAGEAAAAGGVGEGGGQGVGVGWGEREAAEDAAALQQLLSAAPGAVVSFDRS